MQNEVERRIDELGRIVIPKDFLNFLQIQEGDPFNIILAFDHIILNPIKKTSCIFCRRGTELIETPKGYICEDCFQEIKSSIS